MAELLVKAVDAVHPDPDVDRVGCYKAGDIVAVQPDGHHWGSCECLPAFIVVRIPGVSVDDARRYTEPRTITVTPDGPEIIERRRFRLDCLATLGEAQIAEIAAADWLVPNVSESVIEEKQ